MDNYIKLIYNNHTYTLEKTYKEVSQYSSFIASIPVVESQLGGNLDEALKIPIDVSYIKPEEMLPFISYINNPSRQNYKLLTEDLIMVFGFTPSPLDLWLADDFRNSDRFLQQYGQLLMWDTCSMDKKLDNIAAFIKYYGIKTVIIDDFKNKRFNKFMKPLEKMIPNVKIIYKSRTGYERVSDKALYIAFVFHWKVSGRNGYTPSWNGPIYCFYMTAQSYDSTWFASSSGVILESTSIDALTNHVRLASSWIRYRGDDKLYTRGTPTALSHVPTINELDDIILTTRKIDAKNISNIISNYMHNATIIIDPEIDVSEIPEDAITIPMNITIESINMATTIEELGVESDIPNFQVIDSGNEIKDSFIFIVVDVYTLSACHKILSGYYRTESISLYYTL